MIENISRYLEKGDSPLQAALKGSAQIGFTILSLTFSLIAVLIPLLFMEDVVGRLFKEFAVTLAVAILWSAVISLTLTPMMCAHLLKSQHSLSAIEKPPFGSRWMQAAIRYYAELLDLALLHRRLTLGIALGTFLLTVALYAFISKGFFPVQDTGLIQAITEAPQDASFAAISELQKKAADLVLLDPAVDRVASVVGVDGVNATLNTGRMTISLKPQSERDGNLTASEIIRRLQPQLDTLSGLKVYLQPVQDLSIEDRLARSQFQFTLEDPNDQELSLWVPRLVEKLRIRSRNCRTTPCLC
jgi:multidrug efflux pump